METKKIKSALISVFYKDGLEPIVKALHEQGVTIYSTGGTYKFILDLGIEPVAVESLTGYPSILGGRVKTLHPKVFGGMNNIHLPFVFFQQIDLLHPQYLFPNLGI